MSTLAAFLVGWALLCAGFCLGYITASAFARHRDTEPALPLAEPDVAADA